MFFILLVLFSTAAYPQFQEHIIESNLFSARSIVSNDIDNDGDNDIIVSGGENNQLMWIENTDSQGNFSNIHKIIELPFSMFGNNISISDIDGDNDTDIMIVTTEQDCGEIRTFKNTDGLGNFELFSVSMSSCGIHTSIGVGDINDDGNFDWASSVSASEFNIPKISWFSNLGNGSTIEHNIADVFVQSIQIVDLDNDNDNDIVGFTSNNQLFWYENTDNFVNIIQHTIDNNSNLNYYSKAIAVDLDDDGDIDIITTYNNTISWYQNNGLGNFGSKIIINTNEDNIRNVFATDVNLDNNIDIITTGDNNELIWYKNDGQENFSTQTIINNINSLNSPIYAIDINGDNLIDIISKSSETGKIAWYENLGTLSVNQNKLNSVSIYPNPTTNILKINSQTAINKIKVFNKLGILVLSNKNQNELNLTNLNKGLYFIDVEDVYGNNILKKVIKN